MCVFALLLFVVYGNKPFLFLNLEIIWVKYMEGHLLCGQIGYVTSGKFVCLRVYLECFNVFL